MAITYRHNTIRIKNPYTKEFEAMLSTKDAALNPIQLGAMPLIEANDGSLYKLGLDETGIFAIKVADANAITLMLTNEDTGVYADVEGETYNVGEATVADKDGDGTYEFEIEK